MNLKELSEILGLSQTTVSRALNGYPEVSEATRLRVQQIARENNYSPNARARGLATGRASAIGHVIPIGLRHEMVNPIFGDFISGVGEVYAREGFDLIMSVVSGDEEMNAYRNLSARSSVDGVVLHAPLMNDPRIPLLRDLEMPFVVHGRASNEEHPYAWLDVNNTSAFRRATDFLLDLGHTRIALINGLETMDFAYRRREGYVSALSERGITFDPSLMRADEMTEDFGYHSAKEMLARDVAPSAFLSASMICAFGIRRAIEERGLKMGADVSVVTFDDDLSYLANGQNVPIFTACRSSVRTAGVRLAEMLLRQINIPDAPHETELLEAELIAGQSTGPYKD
ncbi:LacI family transcriptional regulator [Planktotalea frisia]|uniref:HTH-type transcriptional regulator RafR n=1 Tax=Planktotalea frisia TaxID=696762 RepID=A0A1L9NUM9_9RHOB|nr:substrate-binding domain-containing protein [Planktotalea frisia]OJI93000.1 HTH-type transcriptional regulator RafR [Planktotalea frisia]PZX34804.1 LacI family transcriptional regulator [Planktotalea frisia]